MSAGTPGPAASPAPAPSGSTAAAPAVPPPPLSARALRLWAALAGVVSAAVVLGAAEIVAVFVGPAASPLFAVGSLVIDLAPAGVKETVIALFGTGDKAALLSLMALFIVVISALAGILELRRSAVGVVVFGVFAVIAVVAVISRAGASPIDGVATIVGSVVGVVVLNTLARRLANWRGANARQSVLASDVQASGARLARRGFLRLTLVAGVSALIVGTGARLMNAGATAVQAIRTRITLPVPALAATPVPTGAVLNVAGISPFVTPNADFYRIDTALQIPNVNPDTWVLKITGMVEKEISLTFAQLLAKPLEEHLATLTCVSNDVGGDLIGNALWLGYPIRDLLAEAGPTGGADMVLSQSVDGFTAGTPLSVLQDPGTNALLAVGMNGEPLPVEHGFPVRMVVPGLYGYVSATKWVIELKVTKFSADQGYWTPRGWDARGPIKIASRIDTPVDRSAVALPSGSSSGAGAGTIAIAGVAWQQHVGVKAVEVQVDDGQWVPAELAEAMTPDTWRQWVYRWPASKGSHTVKVRATDADGVTQGSAYRPPAPNGSEGWHSVSFTVT